MDSDFLFFVPVCDRVWPLEHLLGVDSRLGYWVRVFLDFVVSGHILLNLINFVLVLVVWYFLGAGTPFQWAWTSFLRTKIFNRTAVFDWTLILLRAWFHPRILWIEQKINVLLPLQIFLVQSLEVLFRLSILDFFVLLWLPLTLFLFAWATEFPCLWTCLPRLDYRLSAIVLITLFGHFDIIINHELAFITLRLLVVSFILSLTAGFLNFLNLLVWLFGVIERVALNRADSRLLSKVVAIVCILRFCVFKWSFLSLHRPLILLNFMIRKRLLNSVFNLRRAYCSLSSRLFGLDCLSLGLGWLSSASGFGLSLTLRVTFAVVLLVWFSSRWLFSREHFLFLVLFWQLIFCLWATGRELSRWFALWVDFWRVLGLFCGMFW